MEIFAGIRRIFGHMGPVAVLERWKDEFIGDKVQDYGVVQKCPESGGTAHRELRAFLTNRYGALVLFLECVEMESGKRRTSSYPVQSQARAALAEVLGGDETAFLEHVGLGDGIPEEPRPKGLLARIARRIDPTGEGRKLCDVGVFEELDLPNAAAPSRSDWMAMRFRSRHVICMVGSRPNSRSITATAMEDIRTTAVWQSVMFTASTRLLR